MFQVTSNAKTPKRGSLKDKSGKTGTPRRTGTPRSRNSTPRATSPPLRMTSPGNRVVTSPTHQRVTSPPSRNTPSTSRDLTGGPSGSDSKVQLDTSKKTSPVRKPQPASIIADLTPEYRPTTAPGQMTGNSLMYEISAQSRTRFQKFNINVNYSGVRHFVKCSLLKVNSVCLK